MYPLSRRSVDDEHGQRVRGRLPVFTGDVGLSRSLGGYRAAPDLSSAPALAETRLQGDSRSTDVHCVADVDLRRKELA